MVLVSVKWNKVTFDKIEVDPSQGVAALKATIQDLTDVPAERQKLMCKGLWVGVLKDEFDLSSARFTDNIQITLIGTADTVSKPQKATTFIEDLSISEIANQGIISPAGLNNLGNTCYLNATVQCLRKIPELRTLLSRVGANGQFAQLLAALLKQLDSAGEGVTPFLFVETVRLLYPQFAEMKQGRYMQQDAEEFYNSISSALEHAAQTFSFDKEFSELLHINLEEKLVCNESTSEPEVVRFEQTNKLVCNIQGGANSVVQIDHMIDGIKLALNETIEKQSAVLGRNALWSRRQRMASAPKYLCVQFMRFFWRSNPDSRDSSGVKCKIMRTVSFPERFDVFDLCNDDLQAVLRQRRNENTKAIESSNKKQKLEESSISSSSAAAAEDVSEDAALATAMQISSEGNQLVESGNLPAGFQGIYELHAIVTHQGRSADSGHYLAYARDAPGSSLWWRFDDAKVTEVKVEDVLKLCGGDRDVAYLCFYRMKTD